MALKAAINHMSDSRTALLMEVANESALYKTLPSVLTQMVYHFSVTAYIFFILRIQNSPKINASGRFIWRKKIVYPVTAELTKNRKCITLGLYDIWNREIPQRYLRTAHTGGYQFESWPWNKHSWDVQSCFCQILW